MSRILTGVQSTGTPHLGNLLGAIIPAIEMANDSNNESFLFIANMHTLTQIKDAPTLREHTYSVAATWLAFGLDIEKTVFYRQSDIPQVTELSWYLSCFFPYQRLTLAHSFKDKADRLADVNSGLFSYPMLMAADILLYDAEYIPVGKDQLQHIEMTRDVATRFHAQMGDTFVLPEAKIQEESKYIPGVPDDETLLLDKFKDGAFRLAIDHQIPIVPFVFFDNKKRFSYTFLSGSLGKMRVKILPFISTSGLQPSEKRSLGNKVHELIFNELLTDKNQKRKGAKNF